MPIDLAAALGVPPTVERVRHWAWRCLRRGQLKLTSTRHRRTPRRVRASPRSAHRISDIHIHVVGGGRRGRLSLRGRGHTKGSAASGPVVWGCATAYFYHQGGAACSSPETPHGDAREGEGRDDASADQWGSYGVWCRVER